MEMVLANCFLRLLFFITSIYLFVYVMDIEIYLLHVSMTYYLY